MSLPTFDINPDDLVVRMSDRGEYTPFLCLCDDSKWLLYWSDGDDNYYSPVKEENTPTEAIQKAYDYCVEQGWIKKEEECWQEMQKHQPFGWVKTDEGYELIWHVNKGDDFNAILKTCTFADGTPFGIKEE